MKRLLSVVTLFVSMAASAMAQGEFHALYNGFRTNSAAKAGNQDWYTITNTAAFPIYPISAVIRWSTLPGGAIEITSHLRRRTPVNTNLYNLSYFATTVGAAIGQKFRTGRHPLPAIYAIPPGEVLEIRLTNALNTTVDYQITTGYLP